MTGLDLESFLLLLRADLTTWTVLGLATIGIALLVWLCWRSRRALRKCLVLSLAAHFGLVVYGSTIPTVMSTLGLDRRDDQDRSHIRQIRVAPLVDSTSTSTRPRKRHRSKRLKSGALGSCGSVSETGRCLASGRPAPLGRQGRCFSWYRSTGSALGGSGPSDSQRQGSRARSAAPGAAGRDSYGGGFRSPGATGYLAIDVRRRRPG